ncbi:ATP-dependent helicase HrpB [Aureimonas fodinaquatilis]|uniref:ATP-dependent helicase HrpB n=1 Tax=Aureimonas fodinaquatilis TaxID=2565783 RepID=A0A5B0DNM3_9HYPH|nr:ATP-dependent helicase HrpB [Aureimonas fodinaquatilis]KAA0968487.1 ATP-dependent helicase HrpB [Aureimonas fodinaquatilis]
MSDLPVTAILPQLDTVLKQQGKAVLVAPPGAGKTTLVPLFLKDRPYSSGRILLVEPRRIAARAAASRMAFLLNETVGETVGWRMRLDTRISDRTRIEVITEGVFTRMVLADPDLAGVSAILFDEFHERSLDADLGLALALDVQAALRNDLKIVIMSATLDGARIASLLDNAAVIESSGRSFPVNIEHRDRSGTVRIEDSVAAAVRDALASQAGSILAFLPGQAEILRVKERLEPSLPANIILAPLYGAMDSAGQDLAIRPAPHGQRKVVLATSIAETSITIDGVNTVIDSGLARRPVFEPATGLSRLETVRVSKAAADQRAGRAGRTAPGTAIRLWHSGQTAALPPFDPPEILSTDLSGLILDCAAWGVTDPASLTFLDKPPEAALNEARNLLLQLGAIDATGRLTPRGVAVRDLALPPRLGTMVARAAEGAPRQLAAELAIVLTERGLGGNDPDLMERHRRFRTDRSPRAKAALGLAQRLARQKLPAGDVDHADGAVLLTLAYPDRIALARGARGHFLLSNGRGGVVDEAWTLADAPALVVAELQGQARTGRIHAAAAMRRDILESVLAPHITEEERVAFDTTTRSVRARRVRLLGRAMLAETPLANPAPAAIADALIQGIRQLGVEALPFDKGGERLLGRLAFLHETVGAPWPDMSTGALSDSLEDWLMPFLPGLQKFAEISPAVLADALLARVPANLARRLDTIAPSHFEAPTGNRLPLRYENGQAILAIRVQELFGLVEHPAIADGMLPLTLELLSPAHRPIQITRDLPGFWAGSWRDVRADLRGRYPKHEWPEDPARAVATARAKPRR